MPGFVSSPVSKIPLIPEPHTIPEYLTGIPLDFSNVQAESHQHDDDGYQCESQAHAAIVALGQGVLSFLVRFCGNLEAGLYIHIYELLPETMDGDARFG